LPVFNARRLASTSQAPFCDFPFVWCSVCPPLTRRSHGVVRVARHVSADVWRPERLASANGRRTKRVGTSFSRRRRGDSVTRQELGSPPLQESKRVNLTPFCGRSRGRRVEHDGRGSEWFSRRRPSGAPLQDGGQLGNTSSAASTSAWGNSRPATHSHSISTSRHLFDSNI